MEFAVDGKTSSYPVTQIFSLCFKKSLTLMSVLMGNCVSTCVIAVLVYENGHACIAAIPFGSSFRIAMCSSHVLIFWGGGGHNPYMNEYNIWFL